jgi:hypothetical protein
MSAVDSTVCADPSGAAGWHPAAASPSGRAAERRRIAAAKLAGPPLVARLLSPAAPAAPG